MQDQDDAQTLVQEFYLAVLKVKLLCVDSSCGFRLTFFQEAAVSLEKYSSMVEETLDLEQLDHNNYVVRPEYDPELEEIAGQLAAVSSFCLSLFFLVFKRILQGSGWSG
jgi:hypothetical protein